MAAVGAGLAIAGVFLDAFSGSSYWDIDGTLAWVGLILAGIALLLVAAAFAALPTTGWLAATGAALVGYWAWLPAALAFADLDRARAGVWLCLAGAVLVVAGAGVPLLLTGKLETTPSGISLGSLLALVGIVLVFVGTFLHTTQDLSYWDGPDGLRFFGVFMVTVAGLAVAAWGAAAVGVRTRGVDSVLTLVLLGLVAFYPVQLAFNDLGNLEAGAWLALVGGILAAGGTWAARAAETGRSVTAAAFDTLQGQDTTV